MNYRTAMITRGTLTTLVVAIVAALTFGLTAPASAAQHPRHPAAHLRWEAAQMHCRVTGAVEMPMGGPNQGVTCVTREGGQRFELIYYPRVLPAMYWWREWVRGDSWVTRDGFIVIVPLGSATSGEDSGAYDQRWAGYAARHTDGFLRAI